MADQGWKRLCTLEALEEGAATTIEIGKKKFLVVRRSGKVFVCGNKCTHYGANLADGMLVANEITCPYHTARFDIETGEATSAPALDDIATYEVKVEGSEVFVGRVNEKKDVRVLNRKDETFVIIGAGAAGNTAAETLRKQGFDGKIKMITQEASVPYDRPNLSKGFLSGDDPLDWIPLRSEEFYKEQEIELLTNHRVTGVDPRSKNLTISDGGRTSFDSLLIASGGKARTLEIPGSDLEGSFLLRSLADAERIVGAAENAEKVVILGASFIGLEAAASLCKRGLAVSIVAPETILMERVFGERIGRRIRRYHESKGVEFHLESTPKEIKGNGSVHGVELSNGRTLSADLVITGIGIDPAIDFLADTRLAEGGAVQVDERLQTKAESIFAAGDIALVPYKTGNEPIRVEHWVLLSLLVASIFTPPFRFSKPVTLVER